MKIQPLSQPLMAGGQVQASANKNESGVSFGDLLKDAVNNLNDIQVKSDDMKLKFITGEVQDVHQVTIAMTEAKVAMHLAVEVRNKLLEAYQEVSRMPL
ncbi:flagellar hook-basal body complex protein FliE [Desulfofalx alkaliphila]|uniref:flagellar hook-basal body complex protein FliE n=1 Tax=Desulfofalx alkaliphila TaxID=105483 RepID=UPI0004E21E05|nr:flagellar hook-basal body complex protein FliE [Desulfofalx alkaliphila]